VRERERGRKQRERGRGKDEGRERKRQKYPIDDNNVIRLMVTVVILTVRIRGMSFMRMMMSSILRIIVF
jgi:hypothetical protein